MPKSIVHAVKTYLPNPILKSPVAGIDISMWEPDKVIDWSKMDPRVMVVIAKFSEYSWKDPEVQKHCFRLANMAYKRGGYHFLHEDDIPKQVDTFLRVSREVGALIGKKWMFEVPPILDVEVKARIKGDHFADQIYTWLNMVENACGVKPMIYTSEHFWNDFVCKYVNGHLIPPYWTSDYKLWVAQYPWPVNLNNTPAPRKLPAGWDKWVGWQYFDAYRFQAIKYNGCDVNLIDQEWFDSLGSNGKLAQELLFSNGSRVFLGQGVSV